MDRTSSSPVRPQQLLLRCYVRRTGRNKDRWTAHCIDLDLWAAGNTPEEAQKSMMDAIVGYIETVLDTDDHQSIAALLLRRRAPLPYFVLWYLLGLVSWLRRHDGGPPLAGETFEECVPFQLARV